DSRGDVLADVNPASEHAPNGLHQFPAALLFHDIATGTRSNRPLGIKGFVMHGDDQNWHTRMRFTKVLYDFETVLIGKRDVHEQKIGMRLPHQFHSPARGPRLATNKEIGFTVDELGETFPHHRVVIEDQQALFPFWR